MLDLEKKLENLKTPEIELLSHKQKLRALLLERYAQKQVFSPFKGAVPLGFALIVLFALVLRFPAFQRQDIALAKEIALRDSNFKSLIEQGGIIKETQLSDSKAYMLVDLGESDAGNTQKLAAPLSVSGLTFLVEVDFKEKKVSQIKELSQPSLSFSQKEEAAVREISQQSERVKKEIPLEAEIKEIRPVLIQLKLVKKGNKVEVLPEKEAMIIYQKNGQSWEGMIDLKTASVKKIELVGEKE